jgi:aldehyde:ferredoxin oxidoreductase
MIVEFFFPDVDLYTHEGKAQRAAMMSENSAILDNAILCSFNFIEIGLIPPLLSAVIGREFTDESLREIARRVITLERKFNLAEGMSRKDDTLPARMLNEPLPDGMAEGKKVEGLDIMLDEYYEIRGWDKEGRPPN